MESNFIIFATFMFFILTWLFIILIVYFIPIIVAYVRKHKNILEISLMNIFIGWTFLGWLASLLWAFNSDIKEEDND